VRGRPRDVFIAAEKPELPHPEGRHHQGKNDATNHHSGSLVISLFGHARLRIQKSAATHKQ
jgi:hypothetical protein